MNDPLPVSVEADPHLMDEIEPPMPWWLILPVEAGFAAVVVWLLCRAFT